jgi:DNA repair protein RecO (recombination protein O)
MLQALGFGLDFSRCASGSADMDLVYVSPRSGRAVSRSAGQPYADKLLPLPCFLKSRSLEATGSEVLKALKTTGYFLDHKVFQSTDQIVPAARERLVSALVTERQGSASSTDSAEAAPR